MSKRFPDYLIMNVNSLIRAAAYELRAEKKRTEGDEVKVGIKNFEIVERIKDEVHKLFHRHYLSLTEHYLSTQVSLVLEGKGAERRISQMAIPGLPELAEWLAVPSDEERGGAEWKVPLDCSPNEFKRLEEHREKRIAADQVELEKIRIVRQTAEKRGCDPDEPISTVFNDTPRLPSPSPEDRPRP